MQMNGTRLWRNWVFVHLTSGGSVSAMSSARCVFTGLISSTAHFFGRVSKKRFETTETSMHTGPFEEEIRRLLYTNGTRSYFEAFSLEKVTFKGISFTFLTISGPLTPSDCYY
jgi:hypothetical protein